MEHKQTMSGSDSQSMVLTVDAPAEFHAAERGSSILAKWWLAFAASSVFVVSGHLLIKAGLNKIAALPVTAGLIAKLLHVVFQPEVVLGLLIYCLGTVCWMQAVSQKEISFLYPLSSVNYVLVAAASAILFREIISMRRAVGVILVVLGMVLMNRQSGARAE
jgi:multidrug transporter EmrE-like cation transporter